MLRPSFCACLYFTCIKIYNNPTSHFRLPNLFTWHVIKFYQGVVAFWQTAVISRTKFQSICKRLTDVHCQALSLSLSMFCMPVSFSSGCILRVCEVKSKLAVWSEYPTNARYNCERSIFTYPTTAIFGQNSLFTVYIDIHVLCSENCLKLWTV